MKKSVANIVSNTNKVDFKFPYNKCKTMEEIDTSLPTLIIGYNLAKEHINNFSIIKKRYPEQKLWWTFLKTEKRVDYDRDIKCFSNDVMNILTENVEYKLIDIINMSEEEKKDIWANLLDDREKVIYNHFNKNLFIYVPEEHVVYGISVTTCRFFGKKIDKIIERLRKNTNNIFIDTLNAIPFEIRREKDADIHHLLVLNEYFS